MTLRGVRRALMTILLGVMAAQGCVPDFPAGGVRNAKTRPPKVADTNVERLHVVWNDALLELAGKPYQRGFAARAYLFTGDDDSPVLSDGTFLFYGWKETDSLDMASVRPDRTWSFSPQEAAALAKPDSIGWGYTFWLPWGPADGEEIKCTLRAAFRTADGRVILSDSATVTLPGKSRPLSDYKKLEQLKDIDPSGTASPSTRTETISLELPLSLR